MEGNETFLQEGNRTFFLAYQGQAGGPEFYLQINSIGFCRENLGVQAVESHWGEKGPEGRTVVTLEEGKLREAFFVGGVASGIVRGWR